MNIGSNERVLQTVEQHPEILQQMLATVLNIVMFEDCRNQWSMSRPLLGLILLNDQVKLPKSFTPPQSFCLPPACDLMFFLVIF